MDRDRPARRATSIGATSAAKAAMRSSRPGVRWSRSTTNPSAPASR